ncbi:hypothetical protein ROHU_016973 [Labeo rohita]|uniref:Uncharacterized protein n=1 Tax=Labeo rohita TaxID=84645 RepID=A0A498NIB0_LABRO|nr:hypothetical protein ROHU_016973 [Labeo rohita]
MPSLPAPLSRFIHHCFQPIVVVMVRERAAEGVQRSIGGMLSSWGSEPDAQHGLSLLGAAPQAIPPPLELNLLDL